MSTFNCFGATVAGVLLKYTTGSYSPIADDFGGTAAIQDILAHNEGRILDALPPRIFQCLARPDLLKAVTRAALGQLQFTLPAIFRPLVSGTLHLWRGYPSNFQDRPKLRTDPNYADSYGNSKTNGDFGARYTPQIEMNADSFLVDNASGIVTLLDPLYYDWQVYASFEVDTNNASYGVPSIAHILEDATAGDIGAKIYSRGTDQWQLVSKFNDDFADALDGLSNGSRVPPEIRTLQWWQEVEKAQENRIGSTRAYRT